MFDEMNELHSIMDILQSIDVGLVVLDKSYNISLWNSFMANHSNMSSDAVRDKNIFKMFPETDQKWFRQKLDTVMLLKNRAFSTWEQRPYLFKFHHYRPFTSPEPYMYQNLTLLPLTSATGQVHHVCIIIYDVTEVASHRAMVDEQHHQLQELTRRDGMTDLYVRHYWDSLLETEYLRFSRDDSPRTLLMLDIDNLKDINDDYDYGAGDAAIRHVASRIEDNQRDTDYSSRYGGDKFTLLLTETTEADSLIVASRIHESIGEDPIWFDENEIEVTVSVGVAELTLDAHSATDWISWAEQAMQSAKYSGRNRIVTYSSTKT